MRRKIILLLVLLCSIMGAQAGNEVSVSTVSGRPGEVVTVEVSLTATDAVTAAEIVIPLHKPLTYVEGSAVLNAERAADHTLSAAVVDGALRLYVYSLSLSALKQTEGRLISFDLKLKKEPADYALTPQVVLSDAAGATLATEVQSGCVTLLAPKLEVVSREIDYGHIPIRSTYTGLLTLKNVGNEPLVVSALDFSADEFSAAQPTCTIEGGQTHTLSLTYAPTVRGAIDETVSIRSNAINGVQTARLVADPFSVNELHTGSGVGISDEEVEISLTVNNMEPLVGMQCSFTLPDALKYVDGSFATAARTAGHTPVATCNNGVLTLFLYSTDATPFADNDGVVGTFRVKLDGRSGTYALTPTDVVLSNITVENMTSATSEGYVQVKSPRLNCAESIDMARVSVTEPAVVDFSVRNQGSAPLTLSRAVFLAEGYEMQTALPLTLSAGESTVLKVACAPSMEGDFSTTMNLYTNDPLQRMKAVSITGTAYEPNVLTVEGTIVLDGTYDLTVGMSNYTAIAGMQVDIRWLEGMQTLTSALTPTDRMAGHAYTVADMGGGTYRVIVYSLSNACIAAGEGPLFTLKYTPDAGTVYRDTEITLCNIVLSSVNGKNYASDDEAGCTAAFTQFMKGDTNGDGEVDVADVTNLVYHILRKPTDVFIEDAADVQADGELDVADAVAIVEIILKKQ